MVYVGTALRNERSDPFPTGRKKKETKGSVTYRFQAQFKTYLDYSYPTTVYCIVKEALSHPSF